MPGPTRIEHVGRELQALAFDLDRARAAHHRVDLLLAVLRVVVLGVVVVVGGQVHDLHAEGGDAQFGAGLLQAAAKRALHLVDLLCGVSRHDNSPYP